MDVRDVVLDLRDADSRHAEGERRRLRALAHSLVQATGNVIPIRFSVFALGSLVLLALLVRTAIRLA